jgi:Zn finger protein HypA/HybF involved in hydrogenase expression
MSKTKYNSYQLEGYCMEETTIECTKCKKMSGVQCDASYAMDNFFKEGWRATDNHCYCPKCAKKYLKLKTKKP